MLFFFCLGLATSSNLSSVVSGSGSRGFTGWQSLEPVAVCAGGGSRVVRRGSVESETAEGSWRRGTRRTEVSQWKDRETAPDRDISPEDGTGCTGVWRGIGSLGLYG